MQSVHGVNVLVPDHVLFLLISRSPSLSEMALSALTSSHCIAAHPQSLCNLPHRLRLKVVVQKMNVISGHILWTVVLIHKFSEYLFRSFAVPVGIGMDSSWFSAYSAVDLAVFFSSSVLEDVRKRFRLNMCVSVYWYVTTIKASTAYRRGVDR